ncbi:uncharacterized protein LOC143960154 [Lithobates pipiens]
MSSSRQALILEQKAQTHLCSAIFNERSKQWEKAVEHYEMLLRILNRRLFSECADMQQNYKQLIYETYYHLGIAFQNINQHGKAVLQYTKALQASSMQKKICTVGCSVETFLHTPVLTRRAFAFVKCGETKKALQDAETAVVLDRLNPDVYCVRALVWCTMQKEEEAIRDLNYSLRLNSSHVCSLILRRNIQKYIKQENNACISLNADQEKALQMNYSSVRFSHIKDFNSLHISEFYNSFLWSLNVPHTVVNLPRVCPSVQNSTSSKRTSSAPAILRSKITSLHQDQFKASFRCGAVTSYTKTPELESRGKHARATSAYCLGLREKQSPALSAISFIQFSAVSPIQGANTGSLSKELLKLHSMTPPRSHRTSIQRRERCQKMSEATGFCMFKGSYSGTPTRMYNKPWKGDKLPINEEARKNSQQKNKTFASMK